MSTRVFHEGTARGMRSFSTWNIERLAHNSGFTDLDAVLHNERDKSLFVIEFKPPGKSVSSGQDRMLKGLTVADFRVAEAMVIQDPYWDTVLQGPIPRDLVIQFHRYQDGEQGPTEEMTIDDLESWCHDFSNLPGCSKRYMPATPL